MHALHFTSLLLIAGLVLGSILVGTWPRVYHPGPMMPGHPRPGSPLAATLLYGGRLDLAAATVDDLAALPGIGPGRARRIDAHRARHGPFTSVDDLAAVPGI